MWSVNTRPKPGSTSLAARSASDTGFALGLISNFIAVLPAVGADAGLLAKETAMGSLPGLARPPRLCLVGWASPVPPSCGGLPQPHVLRTCFCGMAKSSMFADMPLDNRTVDQFTGLSRHRWLSQAVSKADRKSTRLNSSHSSISYAVFCLKKKKKYKRVSV